MPSLLAALADLVVPAACVGCARDGSLLCRSCAAPLARPGRLVIPAPANTAVLAAVADYEGAVRAAIIAHKERGALPLAVPLAAALARAVAAAAGDAGAVLVPVPSTAAARRARGDDPMARLARRAARALRRQGRAARVAPLLRHVRLVRDSAGLSAAERAANLAGALAARPPRQRPGERLVLVDDLVTTGATLAEAARALRRAGAPPPAAAVVAVVPRTAGP